MQFSAWRKRLCSAIWIQVFNTACTFTWIVAIIFLKIFNRKKVHSKISENLKTFFKLSAKEVFRAIRKSRDKTINLIKAVLDGNVFIVTTPHSRMNRIIKEAFYIARFYPELNKQVQSFDLTLFPKGAGLRNASLNYKNVQLQADFHSDDDQRDRKRSVSFIFLTSFNLNFLETKINRSIRSIFPKNDIMIN